MPTSPWLTAEGIKQRYPTLNLDDVYLVIGWYLRHRNQVDAYLARREGRVLFSHGADTMAAYAYRRSKEHLAMPGLFVAPRDLRIGDLGEDMLLVATLSFEGVWEGQVRFLPL